ncbi:unnamed protein product [Acidithrix sp. C25]|nr:unnamed protein product [Acidithrix sp. C25]
MSKTIRTYKEEVMVGIEPYILKKAVAEKGVEGRNNKTRSAIVRS